MSRRRWGVALFGALSLLALLGLLVAGAFAATLLDRRSARFANVDAELTVAADYALQTVLAEWDARGLAAIRGGTTQASTMTIPGSTVRATVDVTALSAGMLWMVATVRSERGDETRRINLVARFPFEAYQPDAPLTSAGDVQLGAGVRFTLDTATDRGCARAPAAEVVLAPAAQLDVTDSTRAPVVVARRTNVGDSAHYPLRIDSSNRRDRSRVIYVAGDTTIADGAVGDADGVLFVASGRIRITGRFAFSGLMIAGRGIEATSGETVLRGAVMAYGAPGTTAVRLAGATVEFAPCITMHALKIAHAPRRVSSRSWAELY
jgi:hypothetical protein